MPIGGIKVNGHKVDTKKRVRLVRPHPLLQNWFVRLYCPVLGLVVGPGELFGVGLVVAGVSVPVPPMLEPPMPPLPIEEPPCDSVDFSDVPRDFSLEVPPEVPPVPELPLPDMPEHALSSIAHAIGIIHFIINRSCKDKVAVRTKGRTGGMHAYAFSRSGTAGEVRSNAAMVEATQACCLRTLTLMQAERQCLKKQP